MKRDRSLDENVDVLLIGAGIMSATLGTLLRELNPNFSIEILERMDTIASESSAAWNNAGTGHSGNCELNYSIEQKDGSVDISKAVGVNEAFEISKQFWSYLVEKGTLGKPTTFINPVPHVSFVTGDKNVHYLRKRNEAMQKQILFHGMEYSEDPKVIASWIPLVMEGRDPKQSVAASHMRTGTDVNFGSLTKQLLATLTKTASLKLQSEVVDFKRRADGSWSVLVHDHASNSRRLVKAKFVFIGAGGGALRLLERTEIEESKGFGGIPVGGEWMVTTNPALVSRHQAKVYGQAAIGAPPMSVPHLDTRVIDGEKALLFGPFATFSTKFLKKGSWFDLPASFTFSNFIPITQAGLKNLSLTKYLVSQLMLSPDERLDALKEYFPQAEAKDWRLEKAGQRVQVVKDVEDQGGVLEFGTEVVTSADGSIAALLGASPGASTAAEIMLRVLQKCFAGSMKTPEWQASLKQMIPSYGQILHTNPELLQKVRERESKILGIPFIDLNSKNV